MTDPRVFQVTVDCADPASLAAFWSEVLGFPVQGPPEGFATWDDALEAFGVPADHRNDASALLDAETGRRVFFQKVPEGKTAKNRVHLDVRAAPGLAGAERMEALEAEATRLVGLGATRVARHEPAPPLEAGHIVLADPEGNEFCLD
jgi:catechol 2,3-dioxygenase-like lactoylglutathione lyase family enzyme